MSKIYIIRPGQTLIFLGSKGGDAEQQGEERTYSKHHREVEVTDFTVKDGKARFDVHL